MIVPGRARSTVKKRSEDVKRNGPYTLCACTAVGTPRAGKILMLNISILHTSFLKSHEIIKMEAKPTITVNLLLIKSNTHTKCTLTDYTRVVLYRP